MALSDENGSQLGFGVYRLYTYWLHCEVCCFCLFCTSWCTGLWIDPHVWLSTIVRNTTLAFMRRWSEPLFREVGLTYPSNSSFFSLLPQASLSRSQRAELLRRLFADVALDIDLRAQGTHRE